MTRIQHVMYIDLSDVLRPPGIDILLVLVAALGAILVSIQPVTDPVLASMLALEPTLVALAIFLALRGAAGVTWLVQSGIMHVYLSYPMSRALIALVLIVSRVIIPSSLILGVPLVVVLILLGPTLIGGLERVAVTYLSYIYQAALYGSLFLLVALRVKSQATSGLLSVAIYFTYTAMSTILGSIGRSIGSDSLKMLGDAMHLPSVIYAVYVGSDYDFKQLLLVPLLATLAVIAVIYYMVRRFETL